MEDECVSALGRFQRCETILQPRRLKLIQLHAEVLPQPAHVSLEIRHSLLDKIIVRLMKMLTRQGHLVEEKGESYIADMAADNALASLQAASCTYRMALGPRAGQRVLSLRTVSGRDEKTTAAPAALRISILNAPFSQTRRYHCAAKRSNSRAFAENFPSRTI